MVNWTEEMKTGFTCENINVLKKNNDEKNNKFKQISLNK